MLFSLATGWGLPVAERRLSGSQFASLEDCLWPVSADLTLAFLTAAALQVYRRNAVEVYRKPTEACPQQR